MIPHTARITTILLLVFLLLVPSPVAVACGPYFPVTIFVQIKHPDLPFDQFGAGQLGIIQSSYNPSFLVVAYRYLSGTPFNSSEQQQLVALWAHHYGREDEWLRGKTKDAYQQWLEARYEFAGGPKPASVNNESRTYQGYGAASSQYYEYENCAQDAFLTAAATLEARSKQFGQQSPEVQSWLEGQDTVFDNCGGPFSKTGKPELPEEAPKQLPAILRADRAYQTAAAHFYLQDWDEAEQRFTAIAHDPSSPWQFIAAIVGLRTKLRRITLGDESPDSLHERLAEIDSELRNLEQLPYMHDLRPAIWRMRGFVEFRLDPDARRLELARVIEHDEHPSTLREDLEDYTQLLDRPVREDSAGESVAKPPQKAQSLRSQSPMTDWIFTIQSTEPSSTDHAVAMWEQSHSLPWLLTALAKIAPGSPKASELLQAAAVVEPASPGYLTIAFHRARLLSQSGDRKSAIAITDSVLAISSAQAIPSAANLFKALRMKLASNLDEFLQFAPRYSSVVTFNIDDRDLPNSRVYCGFGSEEMQAACQGRLSPPPMFDFDAAWTITEALPTRMLVEIASSPRLPRDLRQPVAQSAWVRAILLNDETAAHQLTPILSSLSPDLTDGLKTYTAASGSSARFAAVFLILRRPELHPYVSAGVGRQTEPGQMDSFRDNWWCSFAPPAGSGNDYYSMYTQATGPLLNIYPERRLAAPAFLTEPDTKSAGAEWNSLAQLDGAPGWLAKQVLAFAKSHPDDRRVPQALHLVVRATHLGCADAETTRYSRTAFQTLHKRYPNDPWTAKTPYWY